MDLNCPSSFSAALTIWTFFDHRWVRLLFQWTTSVKSSRSS